MKLWKRWTAAVLAAAMALLLLAACGPSGPSAPDAPDKPGTGETGKEPTEGMTEEQKKAAVVDALNMVRKDYGNNTPLELNEQACAFAKEMAQVQLDGVNGKYGIDPMKSEQYAKDWNAISRLTVKGKKLVGVGGYGAYPAESKIREWAEKGSDQKKALVRDESATLVGVGVVQNTDPATMNKIHFMVVVMTY